MSGIDLIAEKHRTNREHKGYTPEHDDTHANAELLGAAMCYLECADLQLTLGDLELAKERDDRWPFEADAWKPNNDPLRNLVHAGALIAAEIERLQRQRAPKGPALCTTNGKPVEEVRASQTNETGQHDGYIVLCPDERAKGFVRPYRDRYQHTTCGTVTTMGRALSETYARDPTFYGATFCCGCNRHLPVSEFVWSADGQVVGS